VAHKGAVFFKQQKIIMKTFNKYFVLILPIILASVILISCERSETNDDQVAPPAATGFSGGKMI
jgi:hypothetical protein